MKIEKIFFPNSLMPVCLNNIQKKKTKNKENFQPIKKTTIQQINYT